MDYISEIFDRLDIQHIREFLLHGVDEMNVSAKDYKERIEAGKKSAMGMLQAKFPDTEEYEKITDHVYDYANAVEEVFMEIGLQCGFILAMQITANTKVPPNNERR